MAKKPVQVQEEEADAGEASNEIGIIELEGNLDETEEPQLLPPKWYVAQVTNVSAPTSKKGNRYFSVELTIFPDQYPPDYDVDNAPDGKKFYYNRLSMPGRDRRSRWNMREFLRKLGLPTNTTQINPDDWMGAKVKAKVTHSTYQGEKRDEVRELEEIS